jgi:Winged helix DNA-binding domain
MGDAIVRSKGDDGRELADLTDLPLPPEDIAAPPRFLSRWDSVLIGYDLRERILPKRYVAAVAKANGDFLPTFLIDGFVAGLWSIEMQKNDAVLRLEAFAKLSRDERRGLEDEGERLVRFHEPEARRHEVTWKR